MLLTGAALGVGSTAGTPAAAAGPSVLLVGDSVMAAFNYSYGAGGVAAVATGYSPTVDARVCRTLVRPSCLAGVSTALQVLQAWRGRLPPLVVIGTGYNDWSIGPAIDAIMQEATNQGARAVVWLTYQDVTSASHYAANNAAVVAATARWPKLRVGHWDAFSEGKTAWFNSDGVHLSGAGSSAYGQLIKASLDAVPPAVDPRCNPATAIGAAGATAGRPPAERPVDRCPPDAAEPCPPGRHPPRGTRRRRRRPRAAAGGCSTSWSPGAVACHPTRRVRS